MPFLGTERLFVDFTLKKVLDVRQREEMDSLRLLDSLDKQKAKLEEQVKQLKDEKTQLSN